MRLDENGRWVAIEPKTPEATPAGEAAESAPAPGEPRTTKAESE